MLICTQGDDRSLQIQTAPDDFIGQVKAVRGRGRWDMVELTYYAYLALLLQQAKLLPRRVEGGVAEIEGLRETLQALTEIRWDAGSRDQLERVLVQPRRGDHPVVQWAKQDRRSHTALTRIVMKKLVGPIRSSSSGSVDESALPRGYTAANPPRREIDNRGRVTLAGHVQPVRD